MTSSIKTVRVECPKCGRVYDDWTRGSLNLGLDSFDAEYVRECSTATCPSCGFVVEFGSLVVVGDVFTFTGPRDMGRDPEDPSFPQPRRPL